MMFKVGIFLASMLGAGNAYSPEALADEVLNLPGAEDLNFSFRQFSGYVKVQNSKNMHYWMVESARDPVNDPIAFWTNGGPGCSGLLGFLTEMGPFATNNKDLTLSLNPYAWNAISTMIFIEQPCGVGFSYSDEEDPLAEGGDYHTDDEQAKKDNYALIQAWLDKFPEYRENDLYITSESYGGHYMPQLSQEIVDRNAAGKDPYLNFKGMAVGNPGTNFYSIIPAGLDTYWGHQLVSKPLYDGFVENCRDAPHFNLTVCEAYYMKMYRAVGNLNPYALDYPVCLQDDSPAGRAKKYGRSQRNVLMNFILPGIFSSLNDDNNNDLRAESLNSLIDIRRSIGLEPNEDYEPCAEDYLTQYLNQESVKEAIHVKPDIEWLDCSRTLRYKVGDRHRDMTPIYNYLIDGNFGLDILVFSGDDDDVCATIGTQNWIWNLGYDAGTNWQAYEVDGQVGGYITKWKGTKLGFATVHGAGHEVPAYKPEAAFWLWDKYLKGELTNE